MEPRPPYIPPPPDVYQELHRPPGGGMHFSLGAVISKGFSVWIRNLPLFVLMAVLCYAPLLGYALIADAPSFVGLDDQESALKLIQYSMIVTFGSVLCNMIVTSSITFATVEQLRGSHASLGKSLKVGLARMLPTLAVSILSGLCVVLGLIACIVPGLIVMCVFYVAVPASVVERPGITGALGRSSNLTRGYRWHIFALIILMYVGTTLVSMPIDMILVEKVEIGDGVEVPKDWRLSMLVQIGTSLIFGSLQAAMAAAAYVGLRNDKEGVGVEELARVFD
jgi:hypothetical protein